MDNYIENLKSDLAEQYKDKPNIAALLETIGIQLNDVKMFFDDLKAKRNICDAEGKQLDGIGDIVLLSRHDISKTSGASSLSDEEYRKYLIYKILRNTCRCTYQDIMQGIKMFWDGPPLRYEEDPSRPATMIFSFDAEKDLANQALGIPYVRAGGVNVNLKMQKNDAFTMYYGFAAGFANSTTLDCLKPQISPATFITDETDFILKDENGAWIKE